MYFFKTGYSTCPGKEWRQGDDESVHTAAAKVFVYVTVSHLVRQIDQRSVGPRQLQNQIFLAL